MAWQYKVTSIGAQVPLGDLSVLLIEPYLQHIWRQFFVYLF